MENKTFTNESLKEMSGFFYETYKICLEATKEMNTGKKTCFFLYDEHLKYENMIVKKPESKK